MANSTTLGSSSLLIPKRILVIGGGPTGLVTLRNLTERGKFDHVELYERRDDVGGVWHFDNPDASPPTESRPRWPSPAYRGLIGNVLPEFLSFSEYPFPEPPSTPHQPFPTLKETHEYLQRFADPYVKSGVIKLNREVVRVEELRDQKGWRVVSRDWNLKGKEEEEVWDAIVVAVGWYDNPVWPNTDGLEELKTRGLAKHAKLWRGPEGYGGKKALVIGNANSSNDIAAQLAPVAQGPVYQSVRRPTFPHIVSLSEERIQTVASVSKYILKKTSGGEKFDALLSDGTIITDLDTVLVGTGYRPLPNFVHVLAESGDNHSPLTSDDSSPRRVPSLHRHVMYAFNPSLAFVGAPVVYTPFTIADLVSTWLSLAWLGETPYPNTSEGRLAYERERLAVIEQYRSGIQNPSSLVVFNVLGQEEQGYASRLREDITKARADFDRVLPVWSDERTVLRESMYSKKLAALKYAKQNAKDQVKF